MAHMDLTNRYILFYLSDFLPESYLLKVLVKMAIFLADKTSVCKVAAGSSA